MRPNRCPKGSAHGSRREGLNDQDNARNECRSATNKRRRRPCDGEDDAGQFLLLKELGYPRGPMSEELGQKHDAGTPD
jgi:hypothetical protein